MEDEIIKNYSLLSVIVVLCLVALACTLTGIGGAPINVTKTADTEDGECTSEDCSLREAVIEANRRAGKNKIVVPAGIYLMTYTDGESLGQLQIEDDVIIEGAGSGLTIIDGSGLIGFYGLFAITSASVDISNLMVRNTDASDRQGGAFKVWTTDSELALSHVLIHSNTADSGAAIYNAGKLSLDTVFITGNNAQSGGGIHLLDGSNFSARASQFENNTAEDKGGAIFSEGDVEILLEDTSFIGNSAVSGGALFIGVGANARVAGSTFENNTSENWGGAIYNEAILAVHQSQLIDNLSTTGAGLFNSTSAQVEIFDSNLQGNRANGAGGAIFNSQGVVNVTRSSLIGNWANDGGAAQNGTNGFMQILSSTISANRVPALGRGSGLMNAGGQLIVKFSTIFNNAPHSGIYVLYGDTFIENSIVTGNQGGNCTGELTSNGHNLIGDTTCGALAAGDVIQSNAVLSGLSWDGNTYVHPLDVGSPAIDAAANLNCPDEDQQLRARPLDGDADGEATCDIGANEYLYLETTQLEIPNNDPSDPTREGFQQPTLLPVQPEPTKVQPSAVPKPTKEPPAVNSGIRGVVWLDADFQGDLDAGETRFNNVTVELRMGGCNTALAQSVQTDANGQYTFSGLQANTYCVRVDISSLPPGNWGASVPSFPPNQSPTLELTVGAGEMLGGTNFGFQNVIQ